MALSPAERLLQQLGVTEPDEIDLEAIAYYVNARVRYRPLDGCEARIIGKGDQAIITVNTNSGYRRKRFSIAHELGHWHHHRGKSLSLVASRSTARAKPSRRSVPPMHMQPISLCRTISFGRLPASRAS